MREVIESWYDVEYLNLGLIWTLWERCPYDPTAAGQRVIRAGARGRAIAAANKCRRQLERPVRVVHHAATQTYLAA